MGAVRRERCWKAKSEAGRTVRQASDKTLEADVIKRSRTWGRQMGRGFLALHCPVHVQPAADEDVLPDAVRCDASLVWVEAASAEGALRLDETSGEMWCLMCIVCDSGREEGCSGGGSEGGGQDGWRQRDERIEDQEKVEKDVANMWLMEGTPGRGYSMERMKTDVWRTKGTHKGRRGARQGAGGDWEVKRTAMSAGAERRSTACNACGPKPGGGFRP